MPPRRALLLNVMRDQLDRFGEIDTTAALLGKVAAATTGHVVLNRDDERDRRARRADAAPTVSYYGVAAELRELFPNDEELYGGPVHVVRRSRPPSSCCACPAPGRPAAAHADRRRRARRRAARRGPAQRAERGRRRGARR